MWQESANIPLHNPNFGIFIASMIPEIFVFLGTETARPDLKITTFIYEFSQILWKRFWNYVVEFLFASQNYISDLKFSH